MARNPRFALAGIPQQTTQRGNNRDPRFNALSVYHLSGWRGVARRCMFVNYDKRKCRQPPGG
jgi:hypothetical protein